MGPQVRRSVGIISSCIDYHASAVAWALAEGGVRSRVFDTFIEGAGAHSGYRISSERESKAELFNDFESDIVWYRKHYSIPTRDVADSDGATFIRQESARYNDWLISNVEEKVPSWFNRPSVTRRAENKLRQLEFARSAGLRIPATIVTARSDVVREFAHQYTEIVVKPLQFYEWRYASGKAAFAFASAVSAEQILNLAPTDIDCCPAIYQECVKKIADHRVVVVGDTLIAYELVQLGDGGPDVDYRTHLHDGGLRYTVCELPVYVSDAIKRMMHIAGLQVASMDLACGEDGEFVFLDLNPGGQWLFLERNCPAPSLLNLFCQALSGSDQGFPSLSDFVAAGEEERFHAEYRRWNPRLLAAAHGMRWHEPGYLRSLGIPEAAGQTSV